jgi:hypothetical protein
MNKNILATTVSLGVVAIAFGIFWAGTPPLKTGGLSYLSALKIERQLQSGSPAIDGLNINRSRDAEGILSATFESDKTPMVFKTDASSAKPADGETLVITSSLGVQDAPEKSNSVISTMLFKAKENPSLVFTIGGDEALGQAKKAVAMQGDALKYNSQCLDISKNTATPLERSVVISLKCDLKFDEAVNQLSFADKNLGELAKLTQGFLAQTGAVKNLDPVVPLASTDTPITFKSGSTLSVFYRADSKAMDRGINFVYKAAH